MLEWQAPGHEVDALVGGRHHDPFALLGPHETTGGLVIRAFVPHADTLEAIEPGGTLIVELDRRHDAGFFEGGCPVARPGRATACGRAMPAANG